MVGLGALLPAGCRGGPHGPGNYNNFLGHLHRGSEVQESWELARGAQLGSRTKRGYESSRPLGAACSTALELS